MIIEGAQVRQAARAECDTVIVGSGCSGSVVASILAASGEDVVVLEEGGAYRVEQYGQFKPTEAFRYLYRDGGASPVFGIGDTPEIFLLLARCVGGGSVVNGGVCFRTPPYILDQWAETLGLADYGPQKMEPFFAEVERILHVQKVPDRLLNRGVLKIREAATRAGYESANISRNVENCCGCARCIVGCPHDAKRTAQLEYLDKAIERGTRVYADCVATQVLVKNGRACGVVASIRDRDTGRHRVKLTVQAKRVVLAAGAIHTPALLLKNGLCKSSGQVGRNLTVHPGMRVYAMFDDEVRAWEGSFQSYAIDHFRRQGIHLINIFAPVGAIAGTLPGIGRQNAELMMAIKHLATFGVMLSDQPGGRVRRGLGQTPLVTYRMALRDKVKFLRGVRIVAQLYFDAGAKRVFLPCVEMPIVNSPDDLAKLEPDQIKASRLECSAQHPLGTCRMGVDPKTSVVGPDGQAHDLPGLYVVDSSVVPTSVAVNPQITIMALATALAQRMVERKAAAPS